MWVGRMGITKCVSITPLGTPVVPLEYGSAMISSAALIGDAGCGTLSKASGNAFAKQSASSIQ